MPALSLKQLATKTAIRNIKGISDIGGLNYALARPFLLKVDNAEQLKKLEVSEPSICGETAEIWRSLLRRDVPTWESKGKAPRDPANWYLTYQKAVKEDQERLNQHSANLRAAMDKQAATKEQNSMHVLARTTAPGKGVKRRHPSDIGTSLGPPSSSRKKVQGRGLLDKARREAREANFLSRKHVELSTLRTPPAPKPQSLQQSLSSSDRAKQAGAVPALAKPRALVRPQVTPASGRSGPSVSSTNGEQTRSRPTGAEVSNQTSVSSNKAMSTAAKPAASSASVPQRSPAPKRSLPKNLPSHIFANPGRSRS